MPDDLLNPTPPPPDDTPDAAAQPGAPTPDALAPPSGAASHEALVTGEPPVDRLHDTQPRRVAAEEPPHTPARPLLLALVMLGAVCLCAVLVGMAGFAGYRDGLATNDARITQTLATGIAEQYAAGVEDMTQGFPGLAVERFGWIGTLQPPPEYARDSAILMAQAGTAAAATPTPRLTATPPPTDTPAATLTPGASDTPAATATLDPLAPEYLYQQAYRSMLVSKYEDAIEWLDSLRALAPDYRPNEVLPMLMEALTEQGKIYLYGWNEDGEDKLMRGVLLIYRADELGTVEPSTLVGQANFVEMYINARNYVNGGQYAAALPVLQQLCDWNCGWSYRGVSVQDLLEQAQAGSGPSQ